MIERMTDRERGRKEEKGGRVEGRRGGGEGAWEKKKRKRTITKIRL